MNEMKMLSWIYPEYLVRYLYGPPHWEAFISIQGGAYMKKLAFFVTMEQLRIGGEIYYEP